VKQVNLRGVTWNHSRALPPLVAASQRFEELHPGITLHWEKRSLHEFGHQSLAPLCRENDLLVIDHPMLGAAVAGGVFLDLRPLLPSAFVADLRSNSVGLSFASYEWDGQLLAAPIDAAAPTASYRPDLLGKLGVEAPKTWPEVSDLARWGQVIMPGFPADVFLNFLGLCASLGSKLPASSEHLVESDIGLVALERMRELACMMPADIYRWNPIAVYETLAATDEYAYCPFAYSYSNYARQGFAAHVVLFANTAELGEGKPLRTVLGGTGLAISAQCAHINAALDYLMYVAGETCQRTLYGLSGGQPAHRQAWLGETLNHVTTNFFRDTLACLDAAIMRPRYNGYIGLQEQGGFPIIEFLKDGGSVQSVLTEIDTLYRQSLPGVRGNSVETGRDE
jgi:multiple sugar transport system substrate-binding protein